MEDQSSSVNAQLPETETLQRAYVVGFLFSGDGDWTLLIQKRRPEWQAGRLNGLGGKIEPGERIDDAMRREGIEEAGVDVDWTHFLSVEYVGTLLHFFAARDEAAFRQAQPGTDEELVRIPTHWASLAERVIPNLVWVIPLARHHLFYETVQLAHVHMSGSGGTLARKQ